jgi:hypothetical protein
MEMTNLEIMNFLHKRYLEIYSQEQLKCLRGSTEDSYVLNGKNILEWHSEATRNLKPDFNHFENIDNLLYTSDSIMYFTGQLYFFRPLLYNPVEYPITIKDKEYYPYHMSLSDRRYFMFSEITFEKIYAFWSQIAILLAASIDEEIDYRRIYFPTILQKVNNQDSESFSWLDKFAKNEYIEFNSHRKMIVHHRSLETKFRSDHTKSFSRKEEMEKIVRERDELPEYFKNHIELTLIGFEKALDLVSKRNIQK